LLMTVGCLIVGLIVVGLCLNLMPGGLSKRNWLLTLGCLDLLVAYVKLGQPASRSGLPWKEAIPSVGRLSHPVAVVYGIACCVLLAGAALFTTMDIGHGSVGTQLDGQRLTDSRILIRVTTGNVATNGTLVVKCGAAQDEFSWSVPRRTSASKVLSGLPGSCSVIFNDEAANETRQVTVNADENPIAIPRNGA
jgi:hypothetical protein